MKAFLVVLLVGVAFYGLMMLAQSDPILATAEVVTERTAVAHQQANAQATLTAVAQAWVQIESAAAATEEARRVMLSSAEAERTWSAASTATQQAWLATQAAAEAQATSTSQVAELFLRWTQEAVDRQATAEAASANAAATSQAVQAGIANEQLMQERIRTERDNASKIPGAFWPYVTLAAGIGLIGWALYLWDHVRVLPRGADGSAPVAIVGGRLVNADRALRPVTDIRAPVQEVDAVQLRVTENDQKIQALRSLTTSRNHGHTAARAALEPLATEQTTDEALPEIAPWSSLASWQGGAFPLGLGMDQTGIVLNPEKTPHLLVAGTSGSGKTMEGLRPMAALGLVSGWQVLLANDAAGDFAPLKEHPNLVPIEGGAGEIADALEAVAAEVDRRSKLLAEAGASTYQRLPDAGQVIGPRLMLVIDELVALATQATGDLSGRIWRAAIHITSKGRKMGIMFLAATTDPTYRTLARPGLIVRDNCARLVFRVRDASVSRAALDMTGAESLGVHQFIAQLDTAPVKGVAFHPSDDELRELLATRVVPALPAPQWLLTAGETAEAPERIRQVAERIRPIWAAGGSKRAMAREIGVEYAGNYCAWIDQAVAWLAATTNESVLEEDANTGG